MTTDAHIEDIAARHRRGEAITADEHATLTANRKPPCPYRSIGRGRARSRAWDAWRHWNGRDA